MTREESIKWAAEIAALQQGKTIQVFLSSGKWADMEEPTFRSDKYRIKPEPKLRAWKPEEVPVGALYRGKEWSKDERGLIIHVAGGLVYVGSINAAMKLEFVLNTGEHSTDGGKTWKACGVIMEGGE